MKIAVYKDNLSTGRGADRAVRNFAAGLIERGYEVALFEKAELEVRLREPFDVIVATGSNEIVDLDRMGYFIHTKRAKVVLQLHLAPSGFFKWRHPLRNRAIRKAFDKADAVQVLCNDYVPEFKKLAPHPTVTVIGNWTDRTVSGDHVSDPGSRTILYPAAALNKIKNQKLLITAFARIASDFPGWKIRLLGKDTTHYADECRGLISRYRLGNRIEVVGFTDDLAGEYSRAAFVAFPSNLEGFPLAVLEAAEFSLCSVAHTDLPGVTDIVRDGETGLAVGGSVSEYAAALRRLMSDAEYRCSLGENARAYCREHYSREKILDKWEMLLKNLAAG